MSKQCSESNRNGRRCGAWAVTGGTKCTLHSDPQRAAKLGSKHRRGAGVPSKLEAAPMEPPKTAGNVRDAFANTMAQVHARRMDPRTANALAYIATSLLRAIEVADLEGRLAALEVTHRAEERAILQSSPLDSDKRAGDRWRRHPFETGS
jgi:hypothetical protein